MSISPSSKTYAKQLTIPSHGAFVGGKFQALAETKEEWAKPLKQAQAQGASMHSHSNAVLKMSPVTPTKYSFDEYNMVFNTSPTIPTNYSAGDHHGPEIPIHFALYLLE
ncbi:hypothetical protein BCON_0131g00170 [Botryotinia convoluta]|uniref:Uncharacterized protein n=1 Tax=Botryotinia convoluta TaxID=54673 RepID=A0A4Z1HVJ1_9HELO|nr:hypothetical protein BCON_0131g00170 [Botryotinia convoluta]